MSDDSDFMAELQRDFLDEVTFLLEQCEESYLKLDQPACRVEELGRIFRLAHSMKGAGSAVGFLDLAGFAHKVEDCLSLLRAHPELVDIEIISILLRAGDAFKQRIDMLKRKDPTPWDIEALQAEVKALTASIEERAGLAPVPSVGVAAPAPLPSAEEIAAALASFDVPPPAVAVKDEFWGDLPSMAAKAEKVAPAALPASAAPTVSAAPTASVSTSIKIDTDRVESVLNLVGELVVIKSQLMTQCGDYASDLKLGTIVSLMDKTIRELQEKTLSMRMTPLKSLFLKTQRIIRDLSLKLDKPIEFKMSGEDTEIDRTMVELLSDPLMHIARNSLDHGIEKSELRKSRGKVEKGSIHLSAQQTGGRVVVKITDDGGGMNRDRILAKAVEKGLIPPSQDPASITDKQVFQFIFAPGFSTAEKVTDVSGRGVGMDVVKTNIERLKGTIEIESREGSGSCLTISIPLTTSITDGMIVQVGEQPYIVPMDSIMELVDLSPSTLVEMHSGQKVVNHRGSILPLVDLRRLLSREPEVDAATESGEGKMVVLVETGRQIIALRVAQVLGQTQVVLKPLGESFKQVQGVAGAAILGDGKVGLVLDPQGLAEFYSATQGSQTGNAA
jgi:two-component system chemotaxis sensor kinase CheA